MIRTSFSGQCFPYIWPLPHWIYSRNNVVWFNDQWIHSTQLWFPVLQAQAANNTASFYVMTLARNVVGTRVCHNNRQCRENFDFMTTHGFQGYALFSIFFCLFWFYYQLFVQSHGIFTHIVPCLSVLSGRTSIKLQNLSWYKTGFVSRQVCSLTDVLPQDLVKSRGHEIRV